MDDFLVINKPVGISSFDVIRQLRKKLGKVKMGHAGTLDPLASGVLPIAVGKATKQIPNLPKEKEYIAEILLGVSTTTDDREGEIITLPCRDTACRVPTGYLSKKNIEKVIKENFTGKIKQKPPLYSAIHFKGKRLYQYFHRDTACHVPMLDDLPERDIDIYEFEILELKNPPFNFPLVRQSSLHVLKGGKAKILKCRIFCSTGTYIRSIARDMGNILGIGGCLYSLVRTLSGGFRIEESKRIDEIDNLG